MQVTTEYSMNNICVYGIGGVGGYFGGKIAYALQNQPVGEQKVFFLARGQHLAAIQRDGLLLNSSEQQGMRCQPAGATDDLRKLPVPDVYLLCVKGYDVDEAARAVASHSHPNTIVIPLLNGVDIYDRIRKHVTTGVVLPSCVYVVSAIQQPGVVAEKGNGGTIVFGPDPQVPSFEPQRLLELLAQMQVRCVWQDTPEPAIWKKYVFIAAFGLVTAYAEKSLGDVMADSHTAGLVRDIMGEIVAIAAARGITLPEDIAATAFETAEKFPFETTTSYQRDVMTPGKPNEGMLFGGTILRLGQELDIPTPVTRSIYSAIETRLGKV